MSLSTTIIAFAPLGPRPGLASGRRFALLFDCVKFHGLWPIIVPLVGVLLVRLPAFLFVRTVEVVSRLPPFLFYLAFVDAVVDNNCLSDHFF